jgi:phosphate transport system substrate-binding protein
VRDGTYHPLSRPIFIYAKISALERPEVRGFVEFYLGDGVPLVREVGYVALTDAELALVRARFSGRTTGTMYEGPSSQTTVTLAERLSR